MASGGTSAQQKRAGSKAAAAKKGTKAAAGAKAADAGGKKSTAKAGGKAADAGSKNTAATADGKAADAGGKKSAATAGGNVVGGKAAGAGGKKGAATAGGKAGAAAKSSAVAAPGGSQAARGVIATSNTQDGVSGRTAAAKFCSLYIRRVYSMQPVDCMIAAPAITSVKFEAQSVAPGTPQLALVTSLTQRLKTPLNQPIPIQTRACWRSSRRWR